MLIKNGKVFLSDGKFHDCALRFGAQVEEIGAFDGEGCDASGCYVIPGLVDVHTHGAMNRDFSDGDPEALGVASKYYAENGVTSFLATTMTLKEHQLMPAMACVKDSGPLPGARCAGIHLEGPFLCYNKRGAQNPDNLHAPDADMFMRLNEASGGAVRLITVAPEVEGGIDFIKRVSPVCTVSVGHTEADYDTAMRAYEAGASHTTHLFNGMPGLHHRKPGPIGAADEGKVVKIRGSVSEFRGALQVTVERIRLAGEDDRYDVTALVPTAPIDGEAMYASVEALLDSITDADYKAVCRELLRRHSESFRTIPAAKSVHHGFLHGLLMHTGNMMQLADFLAGMYADTVDRSLLLAGTFAHDLQKEREFRFSALGLVTDYSVPGQLLGHLVMGAQEIAEIAKELDVPEEKSVLLQHLVLSHHGEPEFGAAVRPVCAESELLSYIDMIDSRMEIYREVLGATPLGGFSDRVFALDGKKLYHHE